MGKQTAGSRHTTAQPGYLGDELLSAKRSHEYTRILLSEIEDAPTISRLLEIEIKIEQKAETFNFISAQYGVLRYALCQRKKDFIISRKQHLINSTGAA